MSADEEKKKLSLKVEVLERAYKVIRKNFKDMVQLLIATVSLSNRFLGGHLKRVAEISRDIAITKGYDKDIKDLIYYSALLHDIGMVGMPERIILGNPDEFDAEDFALWKRHPVIGEDIIASAYSLKRIATVLRSHHEDFSGDGFPDRLRGKDIPLGARVIRIASDYDVYIFKYGLSPHEALERVKAGSSVKYDPEIVYTFESIMDKQLEKQSRIPKMVNINDLRAGMFLNTDIVLKNGLLLLPKGVILNSTMLEKLKSFSSLIDKRIKQVEVIY